MKRTNTSYKISELLVNYLGKNAPEPMDNLYWGTPTDWDGGPCLTEKDERPNIKWVPAYKVHDILSKQFCNAFCKVAKFEWVNFTSLGVSLMWEYQHGGLPEVEKSLCKMMEEHK